MLNKLWKMYIVLGKFLCCKWAHIQKSSYLVTMVTHTEGLAINAQITPNIFFSLKWNISGQFYLYFRFLNFYRFHSPDSEMKFANDWIRTTEATALRTEPQRLHAQNPTKFW